MEAQRSEAGRQRDLGSGWVRWLTGPVLAAMFLAIAAVLPSQLVQRYFFGHPISVVTTILFWIAAGVLLIVWRQTRYELWVIDSLLPSSLRPPQDKTGSELTVASRCAAWLAHLEKLPGEARGGTLAARFREILSRQQRRGHTHGLGDDLRELADRDADAAHDSLQLVRIVVWAIPMLGFLGTVVGITQTLGGLDFTAADGAMERLKSGLYVAFDTTAIGLVLSVAAIFLQFPVERTQQRLLNTVDQMCTDVFAGALPEGADKRSNDPVEMMGEMTEGLLRSIRDTVRVQSDLWQQSIEQSQSYWQQIVGSTGDQVQAALVSAIDASLEKHARYLEKVQNEGAAQIDNRWQQWQTSLSDNARILCAQQKAIIRQGELYAEAAGRAEELAVLRESLDCQLKELSGAQNLASAMKSLAQAVEVLSNRYPSPAMPERRAA